MMPKLIKLEHRTHRYRITLNGRIGGNDDDEEMVNVILMASVLISDIIQPLAKSFSDEMKTQLNGILLMGG